MVPLIKELHHSLAFLRTLLIPHWKCSQLLGLVCVSITALPRTVQCSFNCVWYQRSCRWNHLKEWTLGIKLSNEMHWRWGPTPDLVHQRLHFKHPTSGTELQKLEPLPPSEAPSKAQSRFRCSQSPVEVWLSPLSLGTTGGWHSQLGSEGWGRWHFLMTADFQSCWVTLWCLHTYLLSLRNQFEHQKKIFHS